MTADNKWTTLVEERTEEANEAISEILDKAQDGVQARNNKMIAMGMAAIGVSLIAFGISPFLGLKADINNDNIFADPEAVESVEPSANIEDSDDLDSIFSQLQLGENPLPVNPNLLANENTDEQREPLDLFTNDTEQESEMFFASDLDMEPREFVFSEERNAPQGSSVFAQNTHTGNTDKSVVVFGEDGSVVGIQNNQLHAAAGQDMADAGPEMWFAGIFALFAATVLRRRKIFG